MKKSAQEKYPFKMDYDCEDADFSYVAHTIKTLTIVWVTHSHSIFVSWTLVLTYIPALGHFQSSAWNAFLTFLA